MSERKKNKNKSLRLLYILLAISLVGVLTFGVWIGIDFFLDWQSQNHYVALAASIETRPRGPQSRPAISPVNNPNSNDEHEGSSLGASVEEEQEPWEPYADFDELSERFPGIIGWIKLDGTAINYPIMQWTDNYYFLGHLPDGTRHRSGSIFMDYRNTRDFSDKNTILYGHESRTDDMFGALKHFRNQEFYDAHQIIYIHTPLSDYQLVIFTAYLVDSGVEVPRMDFRDDEHFADYIRDIRGRSFFSSGVEVSVEDRIVTLATCAYDFVNARLVVVGKLVSF
ncbi:MAG: class B sortase [Oscillospiraceae bacterium]|nr:class B sortase [Oscillospiraceae bacterium]